MVVSAKTTHQNQRWVFAVAAVQQNVGHVNNAMWTYLYHPDTTHTSGCKKKRRLAKEQSDRGSGGGGRQTLKNS